MENYVTESVCRERRCLQDERFSRDRERLGKGEDKIDTMEKAIVYLTENAKRTNEELSDHDKRLETLEHRPSMWMDKVIAGIISAVISGAIAILFNVIS